ncbi:hypothetical protein GCM10022222_38790 [Amycolatopsis ultiminotia]|uniref:Uncharacterized protein n=1 Tax=Amycolatopsis ultiminotia TaxID=543629 RepID=A0ABP6WJS8_9PSEU
MCRAPATSAVIAGMALSIEGRRPWGRTRVSRVAMALAEDFLKQVLGICWPVSGETSLRAKPNASEKRVISGPRNFVRKEMSCDQSGESCANAVDDSPAAETLEGADVEGLGPWLQPADVGSRLDHDTLDASQTKLDSYREASGATANDRHRRWWDRIMPRCVGRVSHDPRPEEGCAHGAVDKVIVRTGTSPARGW